MRAGDVATNSRNSSFFCFSKNRLELFARASGLQGIILL